MVYLATVGSYCMILWLFIAIVSSAQSITPYLNYSITVPPKPSTTYDFCSGQLECVDYNPQYHTDSNGHYISDWMFAAIQSTLEYMTPQSLADQCTTSIWAKYSAWSRSTFSLVPLRTETITYDQGYSTKPLIVTTTLHSFGLFEIELQPPCCGGCNLSVAYASLLYWPTPAPSPPMTKVVSANHTFVYPTVYVRYSHIRAWDGCAYKTVQLDEAFVGFDPSKISSLMEWVAPDVWLNATGYPSFYSRRVTTVPLTYSDLREPCGSTVTNKYGTQTHVVGITTIIDGSTYTNYDRCEPTLYVDDVVSELVPGWAACKPVSYGVWDPPGILTPVGQLGTTQAPAPSAVPDLPPKKTSHSQVVATTSASLDPLAPLDSPSAPAPAPASSLEKKQPVPTQPARRVSTGSLSTPATFIPSTGDFGTRDTDHRGPPPETSAAPENGIDPSQTTPKPSDTPSDPSVTKQPVPASESFSRGSVILGPDTDSPDHPASASYTHQTDVVAIITVDSATIPITILPSGAGVVMTAHTLAPNDPAFTVVADIPVSVAFNSHPDPAESASLKLIIGSSTIDLAPTASILISADPAATVPPHQSPLPSVWPVTDFGTLTLVGGGSTVKVKQGATPVTLAGQLVSLDSGGLLAMGTHTATVGAIEQNWVLTAGGLTATAISPSAVNVGETIISAGASAVTIADQLVSLGTNGLLDVGTNTVNVPMARFTVDQDPVITVGGQIATAINPSEAVINWKTISADGSALTLADDEVVSEAGTDALVVVSASATTTERITGQIRSTVGLGELILSAFGGSVSVVTGAGSGAGARPTGSTNGSGVTFFTGEAGRQIISPIAWLKAVIGLAMLRQAFG